MKAGQTPDDIKREQQFVTQADVITLIYPIWWTGLPAILKGYIDRVFAYGFDYAYRDNGIDQLLTGKQGMIINTHGTPKEIYDQIGMTESLKMTSDTGILAFTGIETVGHLLFGSIPDQGKEGMKNVLKEVKQTVDTLF